MLVCVPPRIGDGAIERVLFPVETDLATQSSVDHQAVSSSDRATGEGRSGVKLGLDSLKPW